MFFIAYALKGQVQVFAGRVKNCKSLVLQDKCNIEIFLSHVHSYLEVFSIPSFKNSVDPNQVS